MGHYPTNSKLLFFQIMGASFHSLLVIFSIVKSESVATFSSKTYPESSNAAVYQSDELQKKFKACAALRLWQVIDERLTCKRSVR